jgi:hypothetical protein
MLINHQYDYLLRYWSGTASKPSVDYSVNALNKFAESLKIENCKLNNGVIDAMFRQTTTTDVVPFGANYIPSRIYAVNYDYGQIIMLIKIMIFKMSVITEFGIADTNIEMTE